MEWNFFKRNKNKGLSGGDLKLDGDLTVDQLEGVKAGVGGRPEEEKEARLEQQEYVENLPKTDESLTGSQFKVGVESSEAIDNQENYSQSLPSDGSLSEEELEAIKAGFDNHGDQMGRSR